MPHVSPSKGGPPPDPILQGVPPRFTGLMQRLEDVRERLKGDYGDPTSEQCHQKFMRQLDIYDSPSLLYPISKRPSSAPGNKTRGIRVPIACRPSVQTIGRRARDAMSDHERHLSRIENHLLTYRRAERDLRKMEGELSTEQRGIQASLARWEVERSSNLQDKLREQQENNRGIDRFMQAETRGKSERNKESINRHKDRLHRLNENRKRVTKLETEAESRFKRLTDSLELKTNEIKQLSSDYEEKLRRKEEVQIRLKKELAQIAIGLNRQHQEYRGRDQNELKQSQTETLRDIVTSRVAEENMAQELSQKRTRDAKIEKSLSAADVSISAKSEGLRGKGRKAGRDMVSVQLGLKSNLDQIRLLEAAKREVHNNMMETSLEHRMDAANLKKEARVKAETESLRDRNARAVQEWEKRATDVTLEDGQKKREDAVRELKRCVRAGDVLEQRAFVLARDREGEKVHQMQLVEQLQGELSALKKDNSRKLKEISMQSQKDEDNICQRLSRAQAKLRKSWHARDEQLVVLQQERSRNLEERSLLGEYQREQQRTERVAALSQQGRQTN